MLRSSATCALRALHTAELRRRFRPALERLEDRAPPSETLSILLGLPILPTEASSSAVNLDLFAHDPASNFCSCNSFKLELHTAPSVALASDAEGFVGYEPAFGESNDETAIPAVASETPSPGDSGSAQDSPLSLALNSPERPVSNGQLLILGAAPPVLPIAGIDSTALTLRNIMSNGSFTQAPAASGSIIGQPGRPNEMPPVLAVQGDGGSKLPIVRPMTGAPTGNNAGSGNARPDAKLAYPADDGDGATTSPTQYFSGGYMSTTDTLWWFDGASPQYYSTQVTLTCNDPFWHGESATWTIVTGADYARFGDGSTSETTSSLSITLKSIGASPASDYPNPDVGITCTVGVFEATAQMLIPRPDHLTWLGTDNYSDSTWGNLTDIYYSIQDQFGVTLPRRIELNESWSTDIVSDFAGTTWTRGPAGSLLANPGRWYDHIAGDSANAIPTPLGPQSPASNVKTIHWGQVWKVGSLTIGAGRTVQTDTLQQYQDHSAHENIKSPP